MGPLGRFSHRVATCVCRSVCVSVSSQNTHFRRLWRPLVKEHIPNICMRWQKRKKIFVYFSEINLDWPPPPPPYICKPKTPTSWCHRDFWSMNVFLILACDDTLKKSRIRETKHLSTDTDSSIDAIGGWTRNTQKSYFFEKWKKSPKTQKLKNF